MRQTEGIPPPSVVAETPAAFRVACGARRPHTYVPRGKIRTMKPEIRYARASDGVTIAYFDMGRGPTLLDLPTPPSDHVQLTFEIDQYAAAYQAIADVARVVKYDMRGFGLSDRDVDDFSLEALVRDIEAVADARELRRFAINAFTETATIALAYTALHQERVAGIVLRDGVARGRDARASEREIEDLARTNWATAARRLADATPNILSVADLRKMQELIEDSTTPETFLRYRDAMELWDVSDVLRDITVPVLVTNDGNAGIAPETSRRLAAALPNGSFVGNVVARGDPSPTQAAVTAFFWRLSGARPQATEPAEPDLAFRVILFTDLVGHTEMMRRLGDKDGRALLREHEHITRELLKQHSGAEVKTMGDGFMASFGSVTKAMDCAIALQRAFAAHTESMPEPLHLRVGLNAGEPIEDDGDLFGSTVIMASRVCAHAAAGEILIPEPLRHLLSGKNYVYADHGETTLKGFEDAVRLYEVRWRE
jgi:class 3 adenylate cyclase